MSISNPVASNFHVPTESNLYNLALFVCHLFIDAKFRSTHILYEQNAFDYELLTKIETICPEPMPSYATDISEPFSMPWKPGERTDNFLQMIFFNPVNLRKNMKNYKDHFAFYRVFVFPSSDDENDVKNQYLRVKKYNYGFNSSTLILYHNVKNGSVSINWMPLSNNDKEVQRPVNMDVALVSAQNKKTKSDKHQNLYAQTFGKYEEKRLIALNLVSRGNKQTNKKE